MNLDKYLPYADQPTEKPEAGQWRLIAPSGREFAAPSPIHCVQLEQKTRVTAHVGLGRIARMLNEPESQGSSEPLSSQGAEAGLQGAASSIDTADHVLHKPSGETWLVAMVEGERLTCCGWPESVVPVADCELVKNATAEERQSLLETMSRSEGRRARYAQSRIGATAEAAVQNVAEARRPDEPKSDRPISATQPASPARELTDAELTAIGAKHLEAHAQFVGAGEVWVEGEVEFARAVIARDRALREGSRP